MLTTSFAIKTTKKKQQHKKEIDMLDGYLWLKISLDFTTNVTDQINCYMTSWQNGSKAYYISPFHLIWMLPLSNYHHRCRHPRLSFDFLEMFDHKHKLLVSDYVQMKKPNESVDTVGRSSGVSAETASFCVWLLRNLHQDQLMRKVAVHPLTASIRLVDLLPPVLLLLLLVRVHCPLIAGCISLSHTDEFIFSVFSKQWLLLRHLHQFISISVRIYWPVYWQLHSAAVVENGPLSLLQFSSSHTWWLPGCFCSELLFIAKIVFPIGLADAASAAATNVNTLWFIWSQYGVTEDAEEMHRRWRHHLLRPSQCDPIKEKSEIEGKN